MKINCRLRWMESASGDDYLSIVIPECRQPCPALVSRRLPAGLSLSPTGFFSLPGRRGQAMVVIDDQQISLFWSPSGECVFVCPQCQRHRRKNLYVQTNNSSIVRAVAYTMRANAPITYRIVRLRKRMGIAPEPFTRIPKRKLRDKRCWRWAERLILEDQRLRALL